MTLSFVSGVVAGLVLGFVLWGVEITDLRWNLGKTTRDLAQAQTAPGVTSPASPAALPVAHDR